MTIRFEKSKLLLALMIFFSMTPFILPFPGLGTDLQPYALMLSLLLLLLYHGEIGSALGKNPGVLVLAIPLQVAFLAMVAEGFSFRSFRGAYNHFSIFFVLLALFILLQRMGFPEREIKFVIWIWFAVASIQFFVDREFLAQIISGTREDTFDRGVAGLCSEASYFGISCFYFLHLACRFEKKRLFYMILLTATAVFYAQSMQGLLFVVIFYIGFLLDNLNDKKGFLILLGVVGGSVLGYFLLERIAPDSRLVELLHGIFDQGFVGTVEEDVSASARMKSIRYALEEAFGNYLIPQGFARRIGSGFGGLLVELGIFGLLETLVIAFCFSLQFKKILTRVVYFVLVYLIMFSNTQMGNPQMLLVLATNLYFFNRERNDETTNHIG